MEDCFAQPERSAARVAFNATSGTTDGSDPYTYHQGNHPSPVWDPFDYHQGTDRVLPRPPQPGLPSMPRPDVPLPSRSDVPLPTLPDVPIPLPPLPDSQSPREVRLPDGARNVMDDQGRVILTASSDGRKTREVRYGDAADPTKVTQVTIDHDRTYTRNPDGRSWACEINGQPAGTWYGDIHMSARGEYSFEDDTTRARHKYAANTSEIGDSSQTRPCPDGGCSTYYPQPYDRAPVQYHRPIRESCYNQNNYYDGHCTPGYSNCRPYYGGNFGGQFGAQVLAGMAGYGLSRFGGYPGYYPGYYYGGGNMAGAMVGQVIGRALFGHHRRY